MVITFASILVVLFFFVPPLRHNYFYILHSSIVILVASYIETHYFRASIFGTKTLLLFLVFQLISINLVTILAYYVDKRAAINRRWRIPEKNLHMLELLGGWTGAYFAQKIFHHKTKKQSYQAMFWFMGFAEIAGILIILSHLKLL